VSKDSISLRLVSNLDGEEDLEDVGRLRVPELARLAAGPGAQQREADLAVLVEVRVDALAVGEVVHLSESKETIRIKCGCCSVEHLRTREERARKSIHATTVKSVRKRKIEI
jgi:hypothetical protein